MGHIGAPVVQVWRKGSDVRSKSTGFQKLYSESSQNVLKPLIIAIGVDMIVIVLNICTVIDISRLLKITCIIGVNFRTPI